MNNPYTDEAGVFKNKLGISDAGELSIAEYALTSLRSDEILSGQLDLDGMGYSLARQASIHRYLFQDIYEWAGKIRISPSSKRAANGWVTRFEHAENIEYCWQELEKTIATWTAQQDGSLIDLCHELAIIFIEANRIHAFAEGNGRTLQVLMKQLARRQHIELDYSLMSAQQWNDASAVSGTHGRMFEGMHWIPMQANPEPMKKIFAQIASLQQ